MSTRPTRILVVDDERIIANTISAILKLNGFDPATAFCGLDAIALASSFRPQVALLDFRLPDINGIETGKAIVHAVPDCRVVLLTGMSPSPELLDMLAESERRFDVLVKPMAPLTLVAALKQVAPVACAS